MTPQQLADRFDISLKAAEIRLKELERMQRRRQGIKRPLPASITKYLEDAEKSGYRTPLRRRGKL